MVFSTERSRVQRKILITQREFALISNSIGNELPSTLLEKETVVADFVKYEPLMKNGFEISIERSRKINNAHAYCIQLCNESSQLCQQFTWRKHSEEALIYALPKIAHNGRIAVDICNYKLENEHQVIKTVCSSVLD